MFTDDEALGPENTLGFKPVEARPEEDGVDELANFDTAAGGEESLEEQLSSTQNAESRTSKAIPNKTKTVVSLPVPQDKVRTVMAHALRASESGKKSASFLRNPASGSRCCGDSGSRSRRQGRKTTQDRQSGSG